jgi:hypothetical protein
MAWTESTINKKYLKGVESVLLPDSAGANPTYANSSTIDHDLGNKKFIIVVTVTETCAGDGGADIKVQGSLDNSNWVDFDASLGVDLDTTGANTVVGVADLSLFFAPYYRIQVFTDGTDTVDDATVSISYAVNLLG